MVPAQCMLCIFKICDLSCRVVPYVTVVAIIRLYDTFEETCPLLGSFLQ